MNKTAIKNYAIWARVQLIEAAKQRAYEYEITDGGKNDPNLTSVGGRLLTEVEKEQRWQLIARIRQKGYDQVMEEVAYTWFNRFIALRFMEVNGYLPSKVRVFTDETGTFKPEILKEAMSIELEGLDRGVILDMLDRQDNEALYRYLLIAQCNALNANLPYMFEQIKNWTELLFPANLLRPDSIIGRLISDIDVADWNDEVEIIGWFYQYYISDKHDAVVDPLHGKVVAKDEIPAATQLFTTGWVVRYLLDNSLGRYWLERHPDSKLVEKLKFYVAPKDGIVPSVDDNILPEDIKVLDPCVGSGHFLSYAFDLLLEIYREYGWSDRDAANSIIGNNLYGLDIDDRATQMACFAIMMKARKYNRRIIGAGTQPHILAIQESALISDDLIEFVSGNNISVKDDLKEIRLLFDNAKEYGSIINVPEIDYDAIYSQIQQTQVLPINNLIYAQYQRSAVEELLPLIQQAEIMSRKYDIVATNPPYMNKYSDRLRPYIWTHYANYKGDLFSVFIYRNLLFCKPNGYSGYMTPMVWMFIKTYESLRRYIISEKSITTLIQFEYSAFEEATVPICAFVLKNGKGHSKGHYFRLSDFRGGMEIQRIHVENAIRDRNCGYYYEADESNYTRVPGAPIAYWLKENVLSVFSNKLLFDYCDLRQGLASADDNTFLRLWHEVAFDNIGMNNENAIQAKQSELRWFPCNKGGAFRRWYGNNDYVVDWEDDGKRMKAFSRAVIRNPQYYFREGITWSTISSATAAFRYYPKGFIFNNKGSGIFVREKGIDLLYILGLINSSVAQYNLTVLSPTIGFEIGYVQELPILRSDYDTELKTCEIVEGAIALSRSDWDSFETSWDFQRHPLVVPAVERHYMRMFACWKEWEQTCNERFNQLKANEEELNRIFIDIYGLQDELNPEVADKDVTVRKADLGRDIRSLISYAVGCILGRYSLDAPGLAFAGGEWNPDAYKTYPADADGILPITDDEYFDDDIVGLFINWVCTVYGAETLEDNLGFIADALSGKGTPREVLRQYFLNDFYKDHLKIYQKRPIYWLFSSGKKNGFKCLVYMHRYQPDLLARIRTDYVHEQQERYRTQMTMLTDSLETAAASQRVKLNKQITKIKDQALELQKYEEKIHHLADQMIEIDLDDGVKVNYAKFQDVLEKIK